MFGTFYLATYRKEYKLSHVKLATKQLENHPTPSPSSYVIRSGTFLWKICTRELTVYRFMLLLLGNVWCERVTKCSTFYFVVTVTS